MSRSVDLYDEPDRRDYVSMLFRALDCDDISTDVLRETLESIVKNANHAALDRREEKTLAEFLSGMIDKYRFGEIDMDCAIQDVERLAMSAEHNRLNLRHLVPAGRESLDRLAA